MNKLTIALSAFLLCVATSLQAQEAPKKKKPAFALDAKTMTELGFTPEQKQKMEASKQAHRDAIKKLQDESTNISAVAQQREDSLLTAGQKQKIAAMREAIKTHNTANPTQKKNFVVDQSVATELGLTPAQQQLLTTIHGDEHKGKWQISQRWGKLTAAALKEQEDMFTEEQKKKAAAMKEEIAAYNKTVQ